MAGPVILFDGLCNFCNASVRFIVARDRRAVFRFASLQSRAGREALAAAAAASEPAPDSVVLLDEAGLHTQSEAVLRIARRLGFPWSLAIAGRAVPRRWRDALYAWLARRRYRWFGRLEACPRPAPALRARFLDADEPGSRLVG